jgi:hypothetical protein
MMSSSSNSHGVDPFGAQSRNAAADPFASLAAMPTHVGVGGGAAAVGGGGGVPGLDPFASIGGLSNKPMQHGQQQQQQQWGAAGNGSLI